MVRKYSLDRLRSAIRSLPLEQAKQLHDELGEVIRELETQSKTETTSSKGREVVESKRIGDKIYQLERVRCGKPGCKCAGENGVFHGPYWYAYWRDTGKLKSRYIGKILKPSQIPKE